MKTPALDALLAIVEEETGVLDLCKDLPDDEAVAIKGDGEDVAMTFGHIRRARAELEAIKDVR